MKAWGTAGLYVVNDGCGVVLEEGQIPYDACILWEMQQLWKLGVETGCSCCGHGQREAVIGVNGEDSRELMEALGYEPAEAIHQGCVDTCVKYWFRARSRLNCKRGD